MCNVYVNLLIRQDTVCFDRGMGHGMVRTLAVVGGLLGHFTCAVVLWAVYEPWLWNADQMLHCGRVAILAPAMSNTVIVSPR